MMDSGPTFMEWLQVVTEAVQQALRSDSLKRSRRGFSLVNWSLEKPLEGSNVRLVYWRGLPQPEEVFYYQVLPLAFHALSSF
jgi:hypothetical protein